MTGAGFGAGEPRSARLFGTESAPGSTLSFTAVGDTTVTVGAPGGRVIDGDAPATELALEVRRAIPRQPVDVELPPPLAEPRLDFRIDPASAQSYEVREGEYIQIIDVRGKQCSDFLAFDAAKLAAGHRAWPGRDGDPDADGQRLPAAGPVSQVLRPRHGPARRGGA